MQYHVGLRCLLDEILTDEINDILVETSSKSCLYATNGNEFNEKNVAAEDFNGLASVVTQEICTDNEDGNFWSA